MITTLNADGSTAFVGGTGQREVCYLYDLDGNNERVTTRLSDGSIVEQRSVDGFGQTVVQAQPNTHGGLICTRSEYNALGQVIQQVVDGQAPVVYAYDDMGNVCRQTVLLDAAAPEDATKNRIRTRSISRQVSTRNGNTTSHLRFLYRNCLQVAALDLTRPTLNAMWFITWDPTQPVATRPLAIQKDGTWYTYGWDLTKNICELYTADGYIATAYTYTPYGSVTSNGYADQPLQWSSEYNDTELGLVYYNYRHYNSVDGRWMGRDLLPTLNPCVYSANAPVLFLDVLGAWKDGTRAGDNSTEWLGHSDLGNLSEFDYAKEDHGATSPYRQPNLHFMDLKEIEPPLLQSVKSCNKNSFESNMHRMQDFFAHFSQGHRWPETIGHFFFMEFPDDPTLHAKQFELARKRTELWEDMWMSCCCLKNGNWEQNIANSKQCQELTVPPNDYTIIHSYSELEEARKNAEQEGAKKVFEALFRLMKKMVETSTKRSAKQIGGAASTSPANLKQIYLQR